MKTETLNESAETRQIEAKELWLQTVEDAERRGRLGPAEREHCLDERNLRRWWPLAE